MHLKELWIGHVDAQVSLVKIHAHTYRLHMYWIHCRDSLP